jgi:hypothetical protein
MIMNYVFPVFFSFFFAKVLKALIFARTFEKRAAFNDVLIEIEILNFVKTERNLASLHRRRGG